MTAVRFGETSGWTPPRHFIFAAFTTPLELSAFANIVFQDWYPMGEDSESSDSDSEGDTPRPSLEEYTGRLNFLASESIMLVAKGVLNWMGYQEVAFAFWKSKQSAGGVPAEALAIAAMFVRHHASSS